MTTDEVKLPQPPPDAQRPRERRIRLASLWMWPLLILFWVFGYAWFSVKSVVCWSDEAGVSWLCALPSAFPLAFGVGLVVLLVIALLNLQGHYDDSVQGKSVSLGGMKHKWHTRIRLGYRAVDELRKQDVRRLFFGVMSVLGWTLAGTTFNYLELDLFPWLLGAGVMIGALLLNRFWLQEVAATRYRFGRQQMPHDRWPVAWYNPVVLLQAAREMLSSFNMIRNADPRDQYADQLEVNTFRKETGEDFWFDFVSDTGDGGNATYTVARAVLADSLATAVPPMHSTPRGRLLIMGGDLSYPGANNVEYQYRLLELYEAARPRIGDDRERYTVLAIPQNHDWFDSAATFRRYFVNRNRGEFIGAATPQDCTYFAAQLPHKWWVLGMDFALVGDIDRGQLEGFRSLFDEGVRAKIKAEIKDEKHYAKKPLQPQILPGDNVILVYPEPFWTRPLHDDAAPAYPKRYQRLESELESLGIQIRMRVAGDLHHYVREWQRSGNDLRNLLITCGTGGAFLHPTHAKITSLPKAHSKLQPVEANEALDKEFRHAAFVGTVDPYGDNLLDEQVVYPPRDQSTQLSWRNIFALFKLASNRLPGFGAGVLRGNIMFALLIGGLYWLACFTNSLPFSKAFKDDGFDPVEALHTITYSELLFQWFHALFFSPLALGVHVAMLILCMSIAKEERGMWASKIIPVVHFNCHVVAAATLFWWLSGFVDQVWVWFMQDRCEGACKAVTTSVLRGSLLLICGTVVGGLIFGLYLALSARFGYLANNAFSPIACEDFKGFLRFRIDSGGHLHGYFFGCDKVPRHWQLNGLPAAIAGDTRPAWIEAGAESTAKWRLVDQFVLPNDPQADKSNPHA